MSLVTNSVKFFFQENNLSTAIDQNSRHRILISKTQKLAIHSSQQGTNLLASDLKNSSMVSQQGALRYINSYSPYGYSRVTDGVAALVKFNGERSDSYSGLYFLGQGIRCFSASLMRFYSPDSLSPFDAGGLNCYAYCSGDPVNYSDPSGRMRSPQYIWKRIGSAIRSVLPKRKQMSHTAQKPKPSSVLDIPAREEQFKDLLRDIPNSKIKKYKPKEKQIEFEFYKNSIIDPINYGKDDYTALYQDSKAFSAYANEVLDRGLAGGKTLEIRRAANLHLKNFEITENNILVGIVRGKRQKRWARPSVKNLFGVSR